jgi:hypothetical protein
MTKDKTKTKPKPKVRKERFVGNFQDEFVEHTPKKPKTK